ncbi:hypothetical protein EYY60_14525 [Flavobacterium zhairuonense]|uniref:hypothetical protein n=1 Tax=Flavobacterium zhairuonense TaxID=2493631 RepID=UPI00104F6F92|nr:hypothetical protein [Flavobacterium zhairuonense]KAF2508342.1 hypothetical protein EYY60_14525 [Flavobacterium zhairuonense]
MDGGTISLKIRKGESIFFEVKFVQKVILEYKRKVDHMLIPGSLILNDKEVEIRSKLEKDLLLEIKNAKFGAKIADDKKDSLRKIILDAVDFVESDDYITIAKKVGRIQH